MTNLASSGLTQPPLTWSKHNMTQLTDSMSSENEDTQDLALKHNNNNNNNESDCGDSNEINKEKENTENSIHTIKHYKKLRIDLANGEGNEDMRTTSTKNSDINQDVIASTLASQDKHNYITGSTHSQTTRSPSTSPSSDNSPSSQRTRTPSFSGTPPHPAFSPPRVITPGFERFNKSVPMGGMGPLAGGPTALKQMDSLMNRNCSDLMRSLAAKYNNTNPNEFFSNPHNGHLRHPGLGAFKPRGPSPFLGLPPSISITPSPTAPVVSQEKNTQPMIAPPAVSLAGLHPHPGAPSHMFPPVPGMLPGFPGFPMVDVSSTQVLMNMMRNASVSASQQAQLDNYLRGASKRPSDGPTTPLDLSSSMPNKRLRSDPPKAEENKNGLIISHAIEKHVEVSRPRSNTSPTNSRVTSTPLKKLPTLCSDKSCPSLEAISHWRVEDVINFVESIDLCAEYSEAFRENKIDGSSLPLLTEEHLTSSMNMKLGPAIKLRLLLARKLGACSVCLHCNHCHVLPEERTSTIA